MCKATIPARSLGIIDSDDLLAVGLQQSQHRVEFRSQPLRNDLEGKLLPGIGMKPKHIFLKSIALAVDRDGRLNPLCLCSRVVVRCFRHCGKIVQHYQNRIRNPFTCHNAHGADAHLLVTRHSHAADEPFAISGVLIDGRQKFAACRKCGPKRARILEVSAAKYKLNGFPWRQSQGVELCNLRRRRSKWPGNRPEGEKEFKISDALAHASLSYSPMMMMPNIPGITRSEVRKAGRMSRPLRRSYS